MYCTQYSRALILLAISFAMSSARHTDCPFVHFVCAYMSSVTLYLSTTVDNADYRFTFHPCVCLSIRPLLRRCIRLGYPGPASVTQLDAPSDWRPGGRGFNPRRGRQHSFVEIDHEIFSTVILSLPLIQEGQLSVPGKRMCTILVNRWED